RQRRTEMDEIPSGPMAGRTVLVTGGSGGIGRATALGLVTMGAHLAITGRDRGRTEGAAREIRAAGGGQVYVFVADLSSQSEVRRLADEVLQSLSRIDVLVNNVGGYWNTRHVTADGLERTLALNLLAPFLLTDLLLDRLKQSAPARVVTVSSRASGPTPVHGPTTSPSSPTSCSPTSWPGGCRPPRSPPMRCIPAWCAPLSEPRTPGASSDCSPRSCGLS